jgi:hypothetical protein
MPNSTPPRPGDYVEPEPGPHARAVAVMPPGVTDVVYVEDEASTEMVTDALRAWGLQVRAKRENQHAATMGLESEWAWATVRPEWVPVSRLLNILSPAWFPIGGTELADMPATALSWFTRAA